MTPKIAQYSRTRQIRVTHNKEMLQCTAKKHFYDEVRVGIITQYYEVVTHYQERNKGHRESILDHDAIPNLVA